MAKRSREVKDAVYARDCAMCQICNTTSKLTVHHVQPLSLGGEDDETNGIILCDPCHVETHKQYITGLPWQDFYLYLEWKRQGNV